MSTRGFNQQKEGKVSIRDQNIAKVVSVSPISTITCRSVLLFQDLLGPSSGARLKAIELNCSLDRLEGELIFEKPYVAWLSFLTLNGVNVAVYCAQGRPKDNAPPETLLLEIPSEAIITSATPPTSITPNRFPHNTASSTRAVTGCPSR